MPSVLGVLERRERVALARTEELRAELERLQGAVAEAGRAARGHRPRGDRRVPGRGGR
ncbi:hypothetical protein ACQ4WX_38700 [Streptomyces lasalocidi]